MYPTSSLSSDATTYSRVWLVNGVSYAYLFFFASCVLFLILLSFSFFLFRLPKPVRE